MFDTLWMQVKMRAQLHHGDQLSLVKDRQNGLQTSKPFKI